MKPFFECIAGSITAPRGFLASGVFCNINRLGTGKGSQKGQKPDLALITSEVPGVAAGMFTTNQICAAPVQVSLPRAAKGRAQAIVANSGNANACTGQQGLRDARRMTEYVARQLRLRPDHVLVCSTGRIGMRLPIANVQRGIREAIARLDHTSANARRAAQAIMTTDTHPKEIALEFELAGKAVRIGGICKGAGMIQPGLSGNGCRPAARPLHATMLCFLTTDAAIAAGALKAALAEAVANSFNRITVDGDMSTNDSVIVLANGMAGNAIIRSSRRTDYARFQAGLTFAALELAKMIVRDGEGVSRFIAIHLRGAHTFDEAEAAARAVANSALVKTSWCGGDPNWGRILAALGYSAARVLEKKVDVGYRAPSRGQMLLALKKGRPTRASLGALKRIVESAEFELLIHLHAGRAKTVIYTGDLTEAYIDLNKGE